MDAAFLYPPKNIYIYIMNRGVFFASPCSGLSPGQGLLGGSVGRSVGRLVSRLGGRIPNIPMSGRRIGQSCSGSTGRIPSITGLARTRSGWFRLSVGLAEVLCNEGGSWICLACRLGKGLISRMLLGGFQFEFQFLVSEWNRLNINPTNPRSALVT